LVAKKTMYDLKEGSICEITCPNSYSKEENDGFLVKEIQDANYCQIIEKITDKEKKLMTTFEFPIIEWSKFFDHFEILEE